MAKANDRNQPQKRIPKPIERYNAIMKCLHRCAYNSPSNRLCRAVGFQVKDSEMLQLSARILTQPRIETGLNHEANVRIGRIPLDGYLFTPQPLSALAITYFGDNYATMTDLIERFTRCLIQVREDY